jgi:hypothetical protein
MRRCFSAIVRRLRNKVNGYRLLAKDVIVAEVESRIWDLTDELDYQARAIK